MRSIFSWIAGCLWIATRRSLALMFTPSFMFTPALMFIMSLIFALSLSSSAARADPTAKEYVRRVGGGAHIVPEGQFELAGQRVLCGHRPTVIDNRLDDYGAAYEGFLIMNPRLISRVPDPVKLWIYSHECAHQFRGPDEETADCFAVQRGRRQGWLTPMGLELICNFISPARGDAMHFSGPYRCEQMRRCFGSKRVR